MKPIALLLVLLAPVLARADWTTPSDDAPKRIDPWMAFLNKNVLSVPKRHVEKAPSEVKRFDSYADVFTHKNAMKIPRRRY